MSCTIEIIRDNSTLIRLILIPTWYLITFLITNKLIKKLVLSGEENIDANNDGEVDQKDKKIIRDGYIIGKCENIIILTFILAEAATGLALIFAAKSLARQKDISKNASFFLTGTMVNFTATLVLAFVLKYILTLIPSS
jgi:hypothetical protein